MSDELPNFLHNRQWVILLVLGIFGVIFGFTWAIIIGGLNLQANMNIVIATFFAGWGFGYLACVKTIRDLEKKRSIDLA